MCASLGVFSLRLDPRARLNRLSLATCLCFSLWGFCYAFLHAAPARDDLLFWYGLSAPGWCLFSGFALHYVLTLTGKHSLLARSWVYLALYAPGLVFTLKQITGEMYAADFIRVGFGYAEVPMTDSPWFWLFIAYQSGYALAGIVLIYLWGKRAPARREKKQARVLVVTSVSALTFAFFTDIILPAIHHFTVPALSPIFIFIWAFGIWYSIRRYRFMSINLSDVSDEVVYRMRDLLVLTDTRGIIIKTNPQIEKILGFDIRREPGTRFHALLKDGERAGRAFDAMISSRTPRFEIIGEFITSTGEFIPAEIRASIIQDEFGDPQGVVIIGSDLREKLQLRKEIRERTAAEDILRMKNAAIEKELGHAQRIQKALLPVSVPEHTCIRIGSRSDTAAAIGGDYFSFTEFDSGDLGVFICDVSGHGVSAALFLSLVKFEFDRICRICGDRPKSFMEELNRDLIVNMQNYFLTAVYGIFTFSREDDSAEFIFARGGHPAPIVHRAATGGIEELNCGGTLIGQFRSACFDETRVRLRRGDRVYLYTDGVVETRDCERRFFGVEGMMPILRDNGVASLDATLDAVIGGLTAFRGGGPVEDDIVILGFEIK